MLEDGVFLHLTASLLFAEARVQMFSHIGANEV